MAQIINVVYEENNNLLTIDFQCSGCGAENQIKDFDTKNPTTFTCSSCKKNLQMKFNAETKNWELWEA
ncbi:MAG: hypothetical protein JW737_00320 [Acidobacteria bacterium]|nr:hypothetical protein [Acidobacteriota bacterium]